MIIIVMSVPKSDFIVKYFNNKKRAQIKLIQYLDCFEMIQRWSIQNFRDLEKKLVCGQLFAKIESQIQFMKKENIKQV